MSSLEENIFAIKNGGAGLNGNSDEDTNGNTEDTNGSTEDTNGSTRSNDISTAFEVEEDKIDGKPPPGVFAQVSIKFTELLQSARERMFGEDYWIPTDTYEVAYFPQELLKAHKLIYPQVLGTCGNEFCLMVVQGSTKNEPSVALNHVVYQYSGDINGQKQSLTIFRSKDVGEAIDFYRRCDECRILLKMLDKRKDIRKYIRDVTEKCRDHPLWRMVHIAIICQRLDVFSNEGLKYLKESGYSTDDLINVVASPEGKPSLMLAIETNQVPIVKFLMKLGANPGASDVNGNNAMHYAALTSVQMLETLWEFESSKGLMNLMNIDGHTPIFLAIRNANPRCVRTLLGFGAELHFFSGKNALFEAVQSKGKNIDVIRALLEASPDLLEAKDEATGNTCLHAALHKTPLMGLLFLKRKELDLNAKNKSGLTPLHIFTTRGDLGMVMTLASYECDLNVPTDFGKQTALHIAVARRHLDITRLLLCLGADPNRINEHGDSPRHLAAKLNEVNLLKSLIICGALRCPPTKVGCLSGCVNENTMSINMLRKPSSTPNLTAQAKSSRSQSVIEEFENRTEQGLSGKEKEYRYNRIQDSEHNEIYDDMIQKLTDLVTKKEHNPNIINVLSLDGGGIRGLVITQILMDVEKVLGEPIIKYFDWVAGTSTGSLVASGLSMGQTLRQIQMIYLRFKDQIFEGWSRPYNSVVLEAFIQSEMGQTTMLSEINWPRLMFTTTRADVFPVQLELLRNYMLPLSKEENAELGFQDPREVLLWKALRRSSAAPTYFSSVDSKYIDGGIVANNPTLELLSELQLWNSVNRYMGLPNSVEVGCVLSLGTGAIPSIPMDPNQMDQYSITSPYSTVLGIKNLGVIIVDQATATEGAPVNRASSWCITRRTPYFRLSPPLHKDLPMDTRDDLDVARMMWDCKEYVHKHHDYIEKLCVLLKKVGHSWKRRHLFQTNNPAHCDMQTQTSTPPSPSRSL